jgi:hypothetical protein
MSSSGKQQLKYTAPLPGEEFRSRDLQIAAEAARVLFEIDFSYGDKELCLSVLTRVFRGITSVTQILQDSGRVFQKGGQGGAWQHEAVVQRNIRLAVLEREMLSNSEMSRHLDKELYTARKQEAASRAYLFNARVTLASAGEGGSPQGRGTRAGGREGESVARNLDSDFTSSSNASSIDEAQSTPVPGGQFGGQSEDPAQTVAQSEKWVAEAQEETASVQQQLQEVSERFGELAREVAILRADPKHERFSKEEEVEAKDILRQKGGGEDESKESAGVWNVFLQKLLQAILQAPSSQLARAKVETLASQCIEACTRDSKGLLEFATELDKANQFAMWQARVFNKDAERLAKILASMERKAFVTFNANLKAVEQARWWYIDADGPEPFTKVLSRLRASAVVSPVVPALPVKVSQKRGGGAKEEEEEEIEQEELPRKKKAINVKGSDKHARSVAFADVEEEEEVQPIVAAITTALSAFSSRLDRLERPTTTEQVLEEKPEAVVAAVTGALSAFGTRLDRFEKSLPSERPFSGQSGREGQNFQEESKGNFGGSRWQPQPYGGGRNQGRGGGGWVSQRGGRGGYDGGRGGYSGGRGGSSQRGRSCGFNPCMRPGCDRAHQPGQHKPDEVAYLRQVTFLVQDRCMKSHDTGVCDRPHSCPRKQHGSSNAQAKEVCPLVGKGVCEQFFKGGGGAPRPTGLEGARILKCWLWQQQRKERKTVILFYTRTRTKREEEMTVILI